MQRTLLLKALLIVVLAAIIGIPLLMIQSTIWERIRFHNDAVQSITADSVGEQTVLGPVLVIPYSESWEEEVVDEKTNKTTRRQHNETERLVVFPNTLTVTGKFDTDFRHRGIHQVLIYGGHHDLSGDFDIPTLTSLPRKLANSRLTVGAAYVSLGISDTRGLHNVPVLNWNEYKIEFQQEAKLRANNAGIHAKLGELPLTAAENVKFSFHLDLDGIERLHFVPVGKNNKVTWSSNWPHPQFGGRFLPSTKDRVTSPNGFLANWSVSSLASNAQQQISDGEKVTDEFSVAFIEPINIYSQADRAVKYGFLFVGLTFAAFFLFEVLKRLPIHPIQYTLVGLALALFFLLVVSLSEHIAFLQAYLVASAACILLIGFYLANVLRDWRRGLGFGTGLTILYGALFGLLQSESNALVMGSILLFAVLSAIMVITRKVDWYQLGASAKS